MLLTVSAEGCSFCDTEVQIMTESCSVNCNDVFLLVFWLLSPTFPSYKIIPLLFFSSEIFYMHNCTEQRRSLKHFLFCPIFVGTYSNTLKNNPMFFTKTTYKYKIIHTREYVSSQTGNL